MKSFRVHYLQHVNFEGPGYIRTWLEQQGHTFNGTHLFESGAVLPSPDDFDALVVMGGPMGVYDDHEYSWLRKEKALIEDSIHADKKVLGICLGAQLLAVCLGAFVHTAPNKEIGWFPVKPTDQTQDVPWFHALFQNNPVVFHWHGDQFDIPYGSIDLLSSEANRSQAFQHRPGVIGLQFHLETTQQSLDEMLRNGRHELTTAPFIQDAATILEGSTYIQHNNVMMATVLANWLGTK